MIRRDDDARAAAPDLVSICIPSYQGAQWIGQALESALAQTHRDTEILVVDDGSTDETIEIVSGFRDPRLRIVQNERNLGLVRNWNRCVRLARGEYIKFLFQDDILDPTCVGRMLAILLRSDRTGIVFCRRRIAADDGDDPAVRAWIARYGTLDEPFGVLGDTNAGRTLFERAGRERYARNWIGEPSSVMVRRSAFVHLGAFNTRMVQLADWEMWLRLMYFYDVGYIADPLVTFRVHARSMTARNRARRAHWMDLPWLIEGLRAHEEIRASHPRLPLVGLRHFARGVVFEAARTIVTRRRAATAPGSGAGAYLRYRFVPRRATRLHAPIAP